MAILIQVECCEGTGRNCLLSRCHIYKDAAKKNDTMRDVLASVADTVSKNRIELQPGERSSRDIAWRRWNNLTPEVKEKENEYLRIIARAAGPGGP